MAGGDDYGPHSYGDAFADVYDDWYANLPDTAAAVERLVMLAARAPVLELGVGTGRLAIPLAAAGLDVWGLDASSAMVQRLRAKPGAEGITVAVGDMADLDLRGAARPAPPFGLAFVALNTFFNLVTRQAQERCLARVAASLAPLGRFVVEAIVPTETPGEEATVVEPSTVASETTVLKISRHQPMEQTVDGQHLELAADGIRVRRWRLRYLPPAELDAMAAAAGLRLAVRWGGWRQERFDDESVMHVSVYEAG